MESESLYEELFNPTVPLVPLIERESLIGGLDKGLMGRLILLLAPGGYGKSTLVIQWRERLIARGTIVPWMTLDERHRDPKCIMEQLPEAFCAVSCDLFENAPVAAERKIENMEAKILLFCRRIAQSNQKIVIVLDDFERAESPENVSLFSTLLKHAPSNLVFVVLTRQRPSIPLAKLYSQGLVTEVTAQDIAFDQEDTHRLLQSTFPKDLRVELYTRTSGWAVALQLARMWVEAGGAPEEIFTSFVGEGTSFADYLAEQIVASLAPDVQRFLEDVTILDSFSPDLVDAIRGQTDSARLLARARILFPLVSSDPENARQTRIHPLLKEFLSHRLELRGTDTVAKLHKSAALAFAGRHSTDNPQYLAKSISYALKAGDIDLALDILEGADLTRWIYTSGGTDLFDFFKLVPVDHTRASPKILLAIALCYATAGMISEAERYVDVMEQRFGLTRQGLDEKDRPLKTDFLLLDLFLKVFKDELPDQDFILQVERALNADSFELQSIRFMLQAYLANSYFQRGDLKRSEKATLLFEKACEVQKAYYQQGFARINLAMINLCRGELIACEENLHKAIAVSDIGANSSGIVTKRVAFQFLARVSLERYDIPTLVEYLSKLKGISLDFLVWVDSNAAEFKAVTGLAEAQGGLEAALESLDRLEAANTHSLTPRFRDYLLALRADLLARHGHQLGTILDQALEIHNEISVGPEDADQPDTYGWRELDVIELAAARIYAVRGELTEAMAILSNLYAEAAKGSRILTLIRVLVLRSQLETKLEESWRAEQTLIEALSLGSESGSILPFVLEGQKLWGHIANLTYKTNVDDAVAQHGLKILQARKSSNVVNSGTLLTQREYLVLTELNQGHSNKVIARNLDMAINTVKHHLKSVYNKLEVTGRREAIAISRKRHIVQ